MPAWHAPQREDENGMMEAAWSQAVRAGWANPDGMKGTPPPPPRFFYEGNFEPAFYLRHPKARSVNERSAQLH
jgi:hypothetical protein